MTRSLAIIGALAVGWLVGLQPAANASLARHVGDFGAAFVSVAISLVLVTVVFVLSGDPGRLSSLARFQPAWVLGGLGTAAVVTVGLIVVRPLGAGAVVALLVAGQLVGAVMADRYGWFGLHHIGLSGPRIAGVLLVVAGTVLLTRT